MNRPASAALRVALLLTFAWPTSPAAAQVTKAKDPLQGSVDSKGNDTQGEGTDVNQAAGGARKMSEDTKNLFKIGSTGNETPKSGGNDLGGKDWHQILDRAKETHAETVSQHDLNNYFHRQGIPSLKAELGRIQSNPDVSLDVKTAVQTAADLPQTTPNAPMGAAGQATSGVAASNLMALNGLRAAVSNSAYAPAQAVVAQSYLANANSPSQAYSMASLAIKSDPNYAPGYTVRGLASLAQDDAAGAASDARAALRLAPGDPTAKDLLHFAEARLALKADNSKQAIKNAGRQSETLKSWLKPDESVAEGAAPQRAAGPAPQPGLAAAEPRAGTPEPQLAAAERAAVSPLLREAQARRGVGDLTGALQVAGKAVEQHPNSCDAWNVRADVRSRLGLYGPAVEDATSSLQRCPDNVPALDVRARSLNKLGQFPRALGDADASVEKAPRSPYGYINRADAEEGLGRLRDMAQDLRRAAALDRQYEPRYEAKATQYALPIEPVTMGTDPALFAESRSQSGIGTPDVHSRSNFLTWLLAALIGGFLIALGSVHALLRRTTTRRRRAEAASEPGAGPADAEEGARLKAPFVLRQPIGRGGMGVVYDGWDVNLERRVAIKKMRDEISGDPRERERFIKEARLVASLEHPAIVAVHSIFEEDGELYLVFEYVEGLTLDALLQDRGPLSLAEAGRLLRPVCEALDYAHSRRVIHRDLKPSNIMVTSADKVKVMDFGIARVAKDSMARLTSTNTVAGTPIYMPPEAEQGMVGKAGDIWALGAVAYELLTGRPPFNPPGYAAAKLSRSYARLSSADAGLASADAAVHTALDPDPEKRPKTAVEFCDMLIAGQEGRPKEAS